MSAPPSETSRPGPERSLRLALETALGAHRQVRLALLFGSRARGTSGPNSDLDLAVDAPGADLLSLGAELSARLEVEVHPVQLADAGYPLLKALLRDAVVVRERERGAAASWRTRALIQVENDREWYERMERAFIKRVAERGLTGGR